jgi:hypothetical protein
MCLTSVNMTAAKQLHSSTTNPETKQPYPFLVCQRALAATRNRLEDAREHLAKHGVAMTAELAVEQKQRVEEQKKRAEAAKAKAGSEGKTSEEEEDEETQVRGLYRDPGGTVEINLQTTEVYLRNRMLMPVPSDIAAHSDFRAVFGSAAGPAPSPIATQPKIPGLPPGLMPTPSAAQQSSSLFCVVAANNIHRRLVTLVHGARAYEVSAWKPLSNADEVNVRVAFV